MPLPSELLSPAYKKELEEIKTQIKDLACSRGLIFCPQKRACVGERQKQLVPEVAGVIALPDLAPPLSWACALRAGLGAEGLGASCLPAAPCTASQ